MQVSEYALGSRVDRVGSGPPVFSEKGLPLAVRLHIYMANIYLLIRNCIILYNHASLSPL